MVRFSGLKSGKKFNLDGQTIVKVIEMLEPTDGFEPPTR